MARRRRSTGLPVLRRSTGGAKPPERRTGLPRGVSKTVSKKFQARIKLNGKRYDLGTFDCKEEAAAAYSTAKQSGIAGRPSPVSNGTKRGSGTPRPPRIRGSNSSKLLA